MNNFSKFSEWLFMGLITYFAWQVANNIEIMRQSISELNVRVAVVIEKVTSHDREIESIESRIGTLEKVGR